jgi:hypothetical protein
MAFHGLSFLVRIHLARLCSDSPPCTGGLRSRPVAVASGAPVLRDQDSIVGKEMRTGRTSSSRHSISAYPGGDQDSKRRIDKSSDGHA